MPASKPLQANSSIDPIPKTQESSEDVSRGFTSATEILPWDCSLPDDIHNVNASIQKAPQKRGDWKGSVITTCYASVRSRRVPAQPEDSILVTTAIIQASEHSRLETEEILDPPNVCSLAPFWSTLALRVS
jgi:hypothetical protein